MKARHLVLAGLAVLAAGCGSSSAKPAGSASGSTETPASTTTVAERYLEAANGVDAAYLQWSSAIVGVTQTSALVAPASAYAAALTTFDSAVQGIGASGTAAADINTLISDDEAVITDLNGVGSASSYTTWSAQITTDGTKAIAAGDTTRAALGLPPS
jgi:hypothetical protein